MTKNAKTRSSSGRPHPTRTARKVAALRPLLLLAAVAGVQPACAATGPDLTAMSLEKLMELTVVGASKYEQKQREVAAAVSIITRAEIKTFGWRTIDEALKSLPGVYTTYDRQYTYLGTRGFGLPGDFNTRLLVTVNGNRLNDPIYDAGPMGRQLPLDLDLVERIEFIPGPGGAVYGQNAMFGVVNVVTRTGSDIDGVELAGAHQRPQALREGRATWGKRLDGGVDLLLSVSGLRSRGENLALSFGSTGVSGVAAGLDGERDKEFFGRIARGPWSLDVVFGDRVKNDPTGSYLSDPLVPGQYQGDAYRLAHLQFQDVFADGKLDVQGRLFAGEERYRSRLNYGTPFSFPATSQWRGLELRMLSTAIADHKLMLGIEAQDNTRQDQHALDLSDSGNDVNIPGSGHRAGLYLQDEWRMSESLSATLGLRLDRNNTTGQKLSPRAALIWQAAPATTLKALYGRAHRAPNAFERDYADGYSQAANPSLEGERIDTLEFVVDHRIDQGLAVRGSLYQWTLDDLVVLGTDPSSGLSQYQSGDKIKARGLEVSVDRTWGSGARARGSVSYQDVSDAGGGRLLNSPRMLGNLNVSAPLPWLGLRAGFEWSYSAQRLTRDGSRLGGHAVSNLNLSTGALGERLELSLHVGNLFGKRFAHPAADSNWQNAFDQDGRSVRLRLEARF